MVRRRQCHKMFDKVRCSFLPDDRIFVLKDAYFRIDCSLEMQKVKIDSVHHTLHQHLQTCTECLSAPNETT